MPPTRPPRFPGPTVFPPVQKDEPESRGQVVFRRVILSVGVAVVLGLIPLLIWGTMGSKPKAPAPTAPGPVGGYFHSLAEARKKGASVAAGVELQQIFTVMRVYAEDHNDALPDTLEDLESYPGEFDQLLLNPKTGQKDRFVYTKPAATWSQIKDPAGTALVQEVAITPPNRFQATLYADGRVLLGK